jgi:YidC/Oxa1 family membrane protein insertase
MDHGRAVFCPRVESRDVIHSSLEGRTQSQKEVLVESNQERRTTLAVGLSLLIYMVYIQWFAPTIPVAATVTDVQSLSGAVEQPVGTTVDSTIGSPQTESVNDADGIPTTEPVMEKQPAISDHELKLETDTLSGVLHSREGALRTVSLKDFNDQPKVEALYSWVIDQVTGESSDWVAYQGGTDPEILLEEQSAFIVAGSGDLTSDRRYNLSRDGDAFVATSRLEDGLKITKRYVLGSDPNVVEVVVRFENLSEGSIRDLWIGVADVLDGEAGRYANVKRPFALVAEDVERVEDLSDLEGAAYERFAGAVDWFGLSDKYFMSVIVPLDEMGGEWVVDTIPDGRVTSALRLNQSLDAGAIRELHFMTYMGPKTFDRMKTIGHKLEETIEFGIFGMFSRILLSLLKFYHGVAGNWGVAIILLTLTVKAVFFPLMQKQFISSKRMQAIQPQLKEMREKYKDNQTLQGQMTMKLFKEHNVNPMSGCLPMIIQMPVWFALYNVMLYSVELYGTHFLYLRDLTEVDPTGALPLLVAILMVFQQKMMPLGNMDPMQQKMMRLMPVMFGVFMFTFPAGLVLYFSVNNSLTILQQWFIYRKTDDDIAVPAKT